MPAISFKNAGHDARDGAGGALFDGMHGQNGAGAVVKQVRRLCNHGAVHPRFAPLIRRRRDGRASIEVANSGTPQTESGSTRLGLANAKQRLALSPDSGAGLELHERDGWVPATLTLPENY